MQLAVRNINLTGGVSGKSLELLFEDTGGLPSAGLVAIEKLARSGVSALAGEYHSVVANAIVAEVERLKLPFVCASATLDAITSRRFGHVFRVSAPQSYGWREYASFLVASGIGRVSAIVEDSLYWKAGAMIIEGRLVEAGVPFIRLPLDAITKAMEQLQAAADDDKPHMLLLLVGRPEKLRSIAKEFKDRRRSSRVALGDPAGRTMFRKWWRRVGMSPNAIPFLAYERPGRLTAVGESAARAFQSEYGREASFVALEGYDTVLVIKSAVEAAGSVDAKPLCDALRQIDVQGTRGTIRFSTEPTGVVHQQWKWPPTCVVQFRPGRQSHSSRQVLWDAQLAETGRTKLP